MRALNYKICALVTIGITMHTIPAAMADSWLNIGNNVSTGKIVIDGQEFGEVSGHYLKGSGREKTVTRNLSGYQRIQIGSGGFDVVYTAGKTYSLKITGDDNLVPWLEADVANGELRLSMTRSYSGKLPMTVAITSPKLEAVAIEGTSTIRLNAIRAANFLIHSDGAGDLTANGQVAFLKIHIFGTGDVDVKQLIADQVQVEVKGAGDVVLTARKSLNASVSGVGDLVYFGRPKNVHTKISGVGDIEPGE